MHLLKTARNYDNNNNNNNFNNNFKVIKVGSIYLKAFIISNINIILIQFKSYNNKEY